MSRRRATTTSWVAPRSALQYPALRTEIAYEVLASGSTLANAQCFAASIVDSLSVADMQSGAINQPDRVDELSAARPGRLPGLTLQSRVSARAATAASTTLPRNS